MRGAVFSRMPLRQEKLCKSKGLCKFMLRHSATLLLRGSNALRRRHGGHAATVPNLYWLISQPQRASALRAARHDGRRQRRFRPHRPPPRSLGAGVEEIFARACRPGREHRNGLPRTAQPVPDRPCMTGLQRIRGDGGRREHPAGRAPSRPPVCFRTATGRPALQDVGCDAVGDPSLRPGRRPYNPPQSVYGSTGGPVSTTSWTR